jgi:hypothetical protein
MHHSYAKSHTGHCIYESQPTMVNICSIIPHMGHRIRGIITIIIMDNICWAQDDARLPFEAGDAGANVQSRKIR